jgi:predicted acetyltransferase
MPIKIEPSSMKAPSGLFDLLIDLDGGENGFMGTPVHDGKMTMAQYLQQCRDMLDPSKLPSGYVPQTVYWVLDSNGIAVGMIRLRHHINEKLLNNGGHIGFFIHHDHRGKGYASEALRLALIELGILGEKRALLTVDPENISSIRVIEKNGGRFEDISIDPETGKKLKRYWIELKP